MFYKMLLLTLSSFFLQPCLAQDLLSEDAPPKIQLGGALRFNYNLSTWKEGQRKRGGDFGYDMFRLNASGEFKRINYNAEFRVYSASFGGPMLKQGWFGYNFSEHSEIQVGLQQVPFGIQTYKSHNWFYNITYYVGIEYDNDMDIKYIHDNYDWRWQDAYYLNSEEFIFVELDGSPIRYSYVILGR